MPRTSLFRQAVREFERNYLLKELERNAWNRTQTARQLGLSYRSILYKIEQFELVPPPSQEIDDLEALSA